MRNTREEILKIIQEVLSKHEFSEKIIEEKYQNIDDEDFWDYTIQATNDSTTFGEIEKKIKEELDIEVEIDDCDSLPEEMIRNRYEHDATSAYYDDYRCFNTIRTNENELFLLVISYILDFSAIYKDIEGNEDEDECEYFINISTGERVKKKVHTKLETSYNWADITKIENEDEEEAEMEIRDRIRFGDLYSPYQ